MQLSNIEFMGMSWSGDQSKIPHPVLGRVRARHVLMKHRPRGSSARERRDRLLARSHGEEELHRQRDLIPEARRLDRARLARRLARGQDAVGVHRQARLQIADAFNAAVEELLHLEDVDADHVMVPREKLDAEPATANVLPKIKPTMARTRPIEPRTKPRESNT